MHSPPMKYVVLWTLGTQAELMKEENSMKQFVILMFAAVMTGTALAGENKETEILETGAAMVESEASGMLEAEAEFISLDADQSGTLSKDEVSIDETLVEAFAAADADQDGEISKAEFILYSGDATAAGG